MAWTTPRHWTLWIDVYGQGVDLSIFTAGAAGESITTADFTHDFDTTVQAGASHVLAGNGQDITLGAGHHLVLYNARFDTPDTSNDGNDREEIQTNLNLAGVDLATGWSQGYIRRDSGDFEATTAGGGIIEANEGDTLQLQSFETSNTNKAIERTANATGIQLLKLDDSWNYFRVGGADQTDFLSGSGFGSASNVLYSGTADESDPGFTYTEATGTVELIEGGHYMVFANTYVEGTHATQRVGVGQRLALNGAAVGGTTTSVYIRGGNTQSAQEGAVSIGTIIEASAGDALTVQLMREDPDVGIDLIGGRTSLTIVRLPDGGEYLDVSDSTAQNFNPAGGATLNWDTVNDNVGTTNATTATFDVSTAGADGKIAVQQDDDYLFFNNLFDNNDGGIRGNYNQRWAVDGSEQAYGQTGRYSRSATDNNGTNQINGNWSGALFSGLTAGQEVTVTSHALASTGALSADVNAVRGVRLGSLFPTYDEDNPINIPAPGILGNDTPSDATIVGINGTDLLTGTSTGGTPVTVNADGSFTYDTSDPAIQALDEGDVLTDTFTYTITEDQKYSIDLDPSAARFDSLTDNDDGGGGFAAGDPGAANSEGLTFQVTFTPAAGDLDSTTAAVNLIEVGGGSNGSGLYLLGGEVHFISKMQGSATDIPSLTNDLDFSSGNNMITAKSSFGALEAGTEYTVTAIFDPITGGTLELAVDPSGSAPTVDNFAITGVGGKTNWSGNDTASAFRGVDLFDFGAGNNAGGNPFDEDTMNTNGFEGAQGQALYWSAHATGSGGITQGASLNFDANSPVSGVDSNNWNSTTANQSQNWDFGGDVTLVDVTAETNIVGISNAFRFTGGNGDNNNGSWSSFDEANDATWEFWLKPSDSGTLDAAQTIFESGGAGTGLAIWYEPGTTGDDTGTIHFTIDGGGANKQDTVSAVIDTTDFRQIAAVYDDGGGAGVTDLLQIYVDGVLVDDNDPATTFDDTTDVIGATTDNWTGSNGSGLGNTNDSLAETVSGNGEYSGDISIFRFYENTALTGENVSDNFALVSPATDTATVTLTIEGLNDAPVLDTAEVNEFNPVASRSSTTTGISSPTLYSEFSTTLRPPPSATWTTCRWRASP